jgi:peroxiredoxin
VYGAIRAVGGHIVAISPQLCGHSAEQRAKHSLTFPVVRDVGNAYAGSLGIAIAQTPQVLAWLSKFGIDLGATNQGDTRLPSPATLVVDTDGTVTLAHVVAEYATRLEPSAVVVEVRRLARCAAASGALTQPAPATLARDLPVPHATAGDA